MAHTYNNLYYEIISWKNLILAWKKARKGKTKMDYVIEFEANLRENLLKLREELENQTYFPKPLRDKIINDPKTRKISISDFRDRIVHHAICNIIESIFDKRFIYDSCANRKGKGNLFALKRFDEFARKISKNGKIKNLIDNNQIKGYCLKADIKHYFEEVNHDVLVGTIGRKIKDKQVIWLIRQILNNTSNSFCSRPHSQSKNNISPVKSFGGGGRTSFATKKACPLVILQANSSPIFT